MCASLSNNLRIVPLARPAGKRASPGRCSSVAPLARVERSKITGKSLEQRGGADRISWQRHQIIPRAATVQHPYLPPYSTGRTDGCTRSLARRLSRRSLSRARTATPYSPDCFRAPSRGQPRDDRIAKSAPRRIAGRTVEPEPSRSSRVRRARWTTHACVSVDSVHVTAIRGAHGDANLRVSGGVWEVPAYRSPRRIRRRVNDGELPSERLPKIWFGLGSGETCSGCDQNIHSAQVMYELDWDEKTYRLHAGCHGLWKGALIDRSLHELE
jgi:hypothetical protein